MKQFALIFIIFVAVCGFMFFDQARFDENIEQSSASKSNPNWIDNPTDNIEITASGNIKPENCDDKYLGGAEPIMPKNLSGDVALCYQAFSVLHSDISKTPLWSAELITPTSVKIARRTERASDFFADPGLEPKQRAELDDYRGSGYDRGHLAPSGDMPGPEAQQESFTLANIVPQAAGLNRGSWSSYESDVRDLTYRNDRIYVVTGVLFEDKTVTSLNNRVIVPTSLWKGVAIAGKGAVIATATNQQKPVWKYETADQFNARTGINVFPALAPKDRSRMLKVS